MGYNIPALEKLIDEFRKMPSVGTKSAERMAFYVLGLDAAILPKMKSARFAAMKSATDPQFAWLKVRVMS